MVQNNLILKADGLDTNYLVLGVGFLKLFEISLVHSTLSCIFHLGLPQKNAVVHNHKGTNNE